jgi:hypothetical protein
VESNRVTAESSRVTAETARSNNEAARVTAENNRANAESARATAETNRASAESSRVTTENNRGVAETGRANAEITRCNNETTRLNNETTRQTQEAARVTADAARTQKLADIEEEELLTSIDKANYSYAATKDGSDRIIRKLWSQSDSRRIEQRDRSNFDANNNPQTMTRKLFDDNGKGTSYMEHTLTYDDNNKVLSDTAAEKAYEESMLTITRAGKAFNPLKAINPKTGELEVFNNNAFVKSLNTKTVNLANNDTSLDIVGDKVLNTFNTEAQGTIDIDGIPGVFGDTEGVEYNPNQLIEGEAGAVVNIYEAIGGIDVNAAPAPESSPGVVNSAVWRKITEQSRLDKLKSQNEYPVVLSGADGRTITIAGQTLVQQGSSITGQAGYQTNWGSTAVAVHDDFKSDISVSPMLYKKGVTTDIASLNAAFLAAINSSDPTAAIAALGDSNVDSQTATGNGEIPYAIFKIPVIDVFEQKNGTIPGVCIVPPSF